MRFDLIFLLVLLNLQSLLLLTISFSPQGLLPTICYFFIMARGLFWVSLAPAFIYQIQSRPVYIQTLENTINVKSERSWLWGWAWGAESTVSVVDRSPVVSFPSRPGMKGSIPPKLY